LGVNRTLAGRRILVTAGPTFEDIDAVRFLGNRSSGRMGFAVAEQAQRRGADVILVAGPTTVEPPKVGDVIRVRSAHEMHRVVLDRATAADVVIMAAAVADYTPAGGQVDGKIEKSGSIALSLERTPDILADLGRLRGARSRPVLVGFAAQAGDPIDGARRKLERKQVDLVVANDITQPGAGFEAATNQITFVDRDAVEPRPLETKTEAARAILERVERLLARPTAETALSK
jgi:phosphopantothenoylcysteine decarboxylase/phosphopantothenate--cysteine ligase